MGVLLPLHPVFGNFHVIPTNTMNKRNLNKLWGMLTFNYVNNQLFKENVLKLPLILTLCSNITSFPDFYIILKAAPVGSSPSKWTGDDWDMSGILKSKTLFPG
jgi:hypothetical protein